MKILSLALSCTVLVFAGCAHNSSTSTNQTQQDATIQQGQWEFDFQPPVYNPNFQPNTDGFMEVNLQVSGIQLSASVVDVTGYDPYFSPSAEHTYGAYFTYPFPNGYIKTSCENDTLSGSTSPSLAISVGAGSDIANLTGTVSGTNATSFSGNWTAMVGGHEPWQCEGDAVGSGTFTANFIAPVNGTFLGSLQTSGRMLRPNLGHNFAEWLCCFWFWHSFKYGTGNDLAVLRRQHHRCTGVRSGHWIKRHRNRDLALWWAHSSRREDY